MKILIIGAGVSGLSAGIFALKNGHNVTILEKTGNSGGNLTGWERQGLVIDNCMHWLNGTKRDEPLHDLWRTLDAFDDRDVNFPVKFYTVSAGGKSLTLWCDLQKTLDEWISAAPADEKEIRAFLTAAADSSDPLRRPLCFLKYGGVNLFSLAKRFSHPLSKLLLTGYFGGEFSSAALILAYGALCAGDGGIPKGGSIEMAKRIEARFRSLGGKILYDTPAKIVALRENPLKNDKTILHALGAVDEKGVLHRADAVICSTDAQVTFSKLLPRELMPATLSKKYRNPAAFPIYSSVHAAFSADRSALPSELRGTVVSQILPLRIFSQTYRSMPVREYSYLSSPSNDGKVVLQTLLFQRPDDCRRWIELAADPEAYRRAKKRIGDVLYRRLLSIYPSLSASLELLDVWTPATYARFTGAYEGAYLSFGVTGKAIPTKTKPLVKGTDNVYLATQWQSAPGGLPTAAEAGLRAAKAIGK